MIETLLENTLPDGDSRNERFGNTALHVASIKPNHANVVKSLIASGVDVNAFSHYYPGGPAVNLAAHRGHTEVVRLLLDAKADVNTKSPDWSTTSTGARTFALSESQLEDTKIKFNSYETLLNDGEYHAVGVSPYFLMQQSRCIPGERTALHLGALRNHTDIVSLLISNGARINARDSVGNTALHLAAMYGHTEVAQLLVEAGADVEAQTAYLPGGTPLHLAALNGGGGVVQVLLNRNGNVDSVIEGSDGRRRTPLHLAAKEGHIEALDALLSGSANVDARDKDDRTGLHWAVIGANPKRTFLGMNQRYHHEVVLRLLQAGGDVNAKAANGETL
jgi:ankyrin repeat protein